MIEYISKDNHISIKNIFLDNDHWFSFYNDHHHLIRSSIVENVSRILSCKSMLLGYHYYKCPHCDYTKKIPHSCKSRFCTSCGKMANDIWIDKALKTLPDVRSQHISFTMPSEYWMLFRSNRHLLNEVPKLAANTVLHICKKGKGRKHYLPGIFLAVHTFGRAINLNVHIHLSTTFGGFRIHRGKTTDEYVPGSVIDHKIIKNMWKYSITNMFRQNFKKGMLSPYPEVAHHFKNLTTFNKWLDSHYQKTWNVFLQHSQLGSKPTIMYLGRYLKRPPLAETRLVAYDGNFVSFRFLDHYTKTYKTKTLSVSDFIANLIQHIPDKYFRMIRYYGFLANRVRTKYLTLFNNQYVSKPHHISYLKRFYSVFGKNPLKCACGHFLRLSSISFAIPLGDLLMRHHEKAIACASP